MKIFLYAFLLLWPSTQPLETAEMLRGFMRDALAKQLNNTALADKYFCTVILHRPDEYGTKGRNYMEWALTMERDFLRAKHVNVDKITFTPYEELPANQIPPKPFHMLSGTKDVYVAQYHRKIISYFLLQDDKIASTLLIGQGNENYFVDFCH